MLTVNLSYVTINILKEQSTVMQVGEGWQKKGSKPNQQMYMEQMKTFFVLN